jgi:lipid-binding SYLF domain-containing protein
MYLAGNGGSGVVSARLSDGSWSPPSAFSVRTGGVGLAYGVDVYDCICVLNTQAAVDAYMKSEVQLGAAVSLAAGPIGGDWTMQEVKPVWTYTKSRGVYGGLTVDGTVIKERRDANAEFYNAKVSAADILTGQAGQGEWPAGGSRLLELLKAAQGATADVKVLADITNEPTPGDLKE